MASHHSDEKPLIPDSIRKLTEKKCPHGYWSEGCHICTPAFGATGQYPEGQFGPHDEGEILFGVGHDHGRVMVDFGKPVRSLGMLPEQARGLAALLLKHADDCAGLGTELEPNTKEVCK